MDKNEVELSILRRLEQMIREGIYDPPGNYEDHTDALHGILGDLDHVRREDADDGTVWILPKGSSALIVGPNKEISWILDPDDEAISESAAWVTIAANAIGSEEVTARLRADLFGDIEA